MLRPELDQFNNTLTRGPQTAINKALTKFITAFCKCLQVEKNSDFPTMSTKASPTLAPGLLARSGNGEADVRAFRTILDRDGLNGSAFRIGAGRRVVEREIRRPGLQLVVDDVEGI
jgi:hypothetical protein